MRNDVLDKICGGEQESIPFTIRVIERLEKNDPGHSVFDHKGWRTSLICYLSQVNRLIWDDVRALFWVYHPENGLQVAVFMMPEALRLEPADQAAHGAQQQGV